MCKYVTRVGNAGWIDSRVSFVNVTNDAFFVDQESGAIAKALLLVEDTIILDDCAFEIAEDWKRDSELFGEFSVGGDAVYAHPKNLSVG